MGGDISDQVLSLIQAVMTVCNSRDLLFSQSNKYYLQAWSLKEVKAVNIQTYLSSHQPQLLVLSDLEILIKLRLANR